MIGEGSETCDRERDAARVGTTRVPGTTLPSAWSRKWELLGSVGGVALLVGILSLGQFVLMPLVLATLLAFLLTRPAAFLERLGLPRAVSMTLVLVVVLCAVAGFGYALARQFNDLAAHLPQYSVSIKSKLAALRGVHEGPITQIQDTMTKAGHDLDRQEMTRHPLEVDAAVPPRKEVQPVVIVPNQPSDAERLRATWSPLVRPLAMAGIVLALTIFMLAQREDLYNRLIHLGGPTRVTMIVRTVDEAAQGIRRFLFSQALINATVGVIIALGLLLIGTPYALLWGATAALLRFVPYLGTTIAMLMPAALAFLESDGWARTVETLALFWAAGLSAYVLDPIVNASRTGTSSFALLVSAIFWTWLWGPVGLLLSTPIALCLVAMGKHVPGLEFLTVLLADDPPLERTERAITSTRARTLDLENGKLADVG